MHIHYSVIHAYSLHACASAMYCRTGNFAVIKFREFHGQDPSAKNNVHEMYYTIVKHFSQSAIVKYSRNTSNRETVKNFD